MKASAILLALPIAMAVSTTASAQTILTSAVYNGHTYSLLSNSNWTDAQAKAVSMGGHLVTINDAAENAWAYDAFSNFGGMERNLWIGLNDVAMEGDYVWVSGEISAYRPWAPNQPDNHPFQGPEGEDYVHLFRPSGGFGPQVWNDAPDISDWTTVGRDHGFQYGLVEVVPEPASLAALALGAALLRRRRGTESP